MVELTSILGDSTLLINTQIKSRGHMIHYMQTRPPQRLKCT